jgi:hypothetical protein
MSALDIALEYAAAGHRVFPCKDKNTPLVKWRDAATTDSVTIFGWWSKWPRALIGTPTGEQFVVLDVDPPAGIDTLEKLGFPFWFSTRTSHTPRGGRHAHFLVPEPNIRNTVGGKGRGIGPNLDWRGEAGFVLLPGAGGYRWDPHLGPDTPLLEVPPELLLREPVVVTNSAARPAGVAAGLDAYAEGALDAACRAILAAPNGQQEATLNDECYSIGTLAGAGGIPAGFARDTLRWAAGKLVSYVPSRPWRPGQAEAKVDRDLMLGCGIRGRRAVMRERTWNGDPVRLEAVRQEREKTKSQKPNGGAGYHFPLVRSKDIKLDTSPSYVIEGLIPKDGLVVIWGPPKCGKTFWTFDLMMHVALGWEYRGRLIEPGTVVYIACEGERGLAARNAAFRQDKISDAGDDDPPFYLLTTRLDLPGEVNTLIFDIAAQIPPDEPRSCIVLDTLNRSIRGSESSDEDMSAYVAAADALRERFKCAVIIIHHCGTDGTRPRGHTSLTGACDAQLAVSRDAVDKVITTIEFMKDGAEGEPLASTLRIVEVGTDDNEKPITSLVIDPADPPQKQTVKKRIQLSDGAKIALKQLKNALAAPNISEPVPESGSVKSGTRGIKIDLWRKYCYQAGISEGEAESAKRNAFNRAREKLLAEEIINGWGEWVWIP